MRVEHGVCDQYWDILLMAYYWGYWESTSSTVYLQLCTKFQPGLGFSISKLVHRILLRMSSMVLAAAAANSLQSCPTLCDPRDGRPPGSPVPGILQAEHWSGLPLHWGNHVGPLGQHILLHDGPWGGTKDPWVWLMAKPLILSITSLFSLASVLSSFSD